jgi:hypothetical protein
MACPVKKKTKIKGWLKKMEKKTIKNEKKTVSTISEVV